MIPGDFKELTGLADNGTTTMFIQHVFKSDYSGNHGPDVCLKNFGEEDESCRKYNRLNGYA